MLSLHEYQSYHTDTNLIKYYSYSRRSSFKEPWENSIYGENWIRDSDYCFDKSVLNLFKILIQILKLSLFVHGE
jgi:hypothetical protein